MAVTLAPLYHRRHDSVDKDHVGTAFQESTMLWRAWRGAAIAVLGIVMVKAFLGSAEQLLWLTSTPTGYSARSRLMQRNLPGLRPGMRRALIP